MTAIIMMNDLKMIAKNKQKFEIIIFPHFPNRLNSFISCSLAHSVVQVQEEEEEGGWRKFICSISPDTPPPYKKDDWNLWNGRHHHSSYYYYLKEHSTNAYSIDVGGGGGPS